MKKNFFYLALSLCVALTTLSCGSDDDGGDGIPHYTQQKFAEQTAAFTVNENEVVAITTSGNSDEKVSLTGLNFTESGKAIIETTHERSDGKKTVKYTTYDADINGNTYTVKDGSKVQGTVAYTTVRAAGEGVMITINLTVKIGDVEFKFATTEPASAVKLLEAMAQTVGLTNITRTWTVERMKLTLDFEDKPDASTEVNNGSLKEFQELAERQNIILKETDRTALNRTIQGITLDKYGLFTITYSDKYNDAAKWQWVAGSNDSKINIVLKDEEMGNKFLQTNMSIDVQYPGNDKLTLKLTVKLPEDKCTAYMTLNLK
jgi:hypothetical protein